VVELRGYGVVLADVQEGHDGRAEEPRCKKSQGQNWHFMSKYMYFSEKSD
jgi:hypothetical protein